MRKRRYGFDEAKTVKYAKEGRGRGLGRDYRPWLEITDLPSTGRSHRAYSCKTERVHHLLSDGEWRTFLRFEADPDVITIYEQYPMDRAETYSIAMQCGYRPSLTLDGTRYVLTVDFLVEYRTPPRLRAYSFKYSRDDLPRRQRELHRIAEIYFKRREIPFEIRDSSSFNEYFERAFESIRQCHDFRGRVEPSQDAVSRVPPYILYAIRNLPETTVLQASQQIGQVVGHTSSAVFSVLKHMLARNVLSVDLFLPRDLTEITMGEFVISQEHSG